MCHNIQNKQLYPILSGKSFECHTEKLLNQSLCKIDVFILFGLNSTNQGLPMELRIRIILVLLPLHNEGERMDLEVTTIKSTVCYYRDEL